MSAASRVLAWIAAAGAYGVGLYHWLGARAASEYFTTYAIEWTMSLDNLIVLSAAVLAAPEAVRSKVLRFGILGAVVMRFVMIVGGTSLVGHYHSIFYFFGAFLILLALQMLSPRLDILSRAAAPLRAAAKGTLTGLRDPLVLGIMTVIGYDFVFALDSVPAALAISRNWKIIFAANAFSVMGLGSLYVVIEILERKFHALSKGVAAVLIFIGAKMIAEPFFDVELNSLVSLAAVLGLLGSSMVYSLVVDA
jgi:tellurite resistance protein TerC